VILYAKTQSTFNEEEKKTFNEENYVVDADLAFS
jgi:hypothetical protein